MEENYFYDSAAKAYFSEINTNLNEKDLLDEDLLITYANLRSQELQLQKLVYKEGFRVTNVNSRGKETYQVNPSYRAYLACVAEKNKIYSKIKRLLNKTTSEECDDFDNF